MATDAAPFYYQQTDREAVFDPALRTYVKPGEERPPIKPRRLIPKVIFSCKRCGLQWSGKGAHHPVKIHAQVTGHAISRQVKRP